MRCKHSLASLLACEKSFSVWWLSIICRSHFFLQKLTRRDAPYLAELIIRQERLTKLAVCRAVGTRGKEGGTIATPLKILANMLTLSHSGGRGDTTLLLSPPLDVQAFLRPWFVHSLAKQSYLTAYITISLGWLWRKKSKLSSSSHKNAEKRGLRVIYFSSISNLRTLSQS